jgi:hypothetical protein
VNRWSAWLFPVTYALHVTEEHLFDFPGWLSDQFGVLLNSREFLLLNAFGLSLMSLAIAIASRNTRRYAWLFAGLASTFVLNAVTHIAACVLTASYSPGTASAVLFWLPMSLVVFRRCAPALAGWRLAASVAGGFAVHLIVWITPMVMQRSA